MIKRGKRAKRVSAHQRLVLEADAWVKAIVDNRQNNECLRRASKIPVSCGGPLQGAHILRKGGMYNALRHSLENVIVMCRNHHLFWAHVDEHAFYEWIEQLYPGRIAQLKSAAQYRQRVDLKELICVLKAIYAQESKL